MDDSQNLSNIRVSNDATGGPYIIVPVAQLSQVREKLNRNNVPYWVDSHSISLDGKPAVIFVNLGRSENPIKIQAILDGAI